MQTDLVLQKATGAFRAPADRRAFLKLARVAAAGVVLPLRGEALPDSPPTRPAPGPFRAGGRLVEAHTLAVGGVAVQYYECGNPSGRPVVLVHGFPDSPVAWQGVADQVDLTKYRLVLPFLRGFGQTFVAPAACVSGQEVALAHDLLTFLDALHIERFHLVGHDWGARTAYAAAVLAPERIRTLTALASPYLVWQGAALPPAQVRGYWYQLYFQLDEAQAMLRDHRQDFCREPWRSWCPQWQFTDEEFAAAALAWDNPQFVDIVLDYYRIRWHNAIGRPAYAQEQARLDVKPQPPIAVPTVFIQGNADTCDSVAGSAGQEQCFSKGYERVILPGVAHFPHRENPKAVAQVLRRQLEGLH